MMDRQICVVGAGKWGQNHVRTLNDLGCLGGVVDADEKSLIKISNYYPDIMTYPDIDEAIQNQNFSAFIVATPAHTHFSIAKKIISSKNHILIEKPMALTIKDAEEIVYLAKKYSVNLMVGHLMLFHPAIVKIKKMILNGEIGDLQYIYSNRLNLGQIRSKENVFWSFAPHDISIFQFLTSSFPSEITASASSFLQEGIFDSTITHLKYPNNIMGHIFVSWLHPFKEHRLVVIGSEGMLSYEDSSEDKSLKYYSKKYNINKGIPEKIDGPIKMIDYEKKLPLTEELIYFIKNLDSNINIADGQHALDVIKILVLAMNYLKSNHKLKN